MKKMYKQLKDLPWSKKGSLWEINDNNISIDGFNYSLIDHMQTLVKYYTAEDGTIDMDDGIWFELAGDENYKRRVKEAEQYQLRMEKVYLEGRIKEINTKLK